MPRDTASRSLSDPAIRVPIRRFQVTTLATGLVTALASAGVLTLQGDRDYARAVLESREWSEAGITDAQVDSFLTPSWGVPGAVLGVLAVTALLCWGAQRLVRPTRWLGTVAVVLALLTAVFWAVDGGRMVATGAGGAATLVAVGAMAVFCAVWLLIAHQRGVRDAFEG